MCLRIYQLVCRPENSLSFQTADPHVYTADVGRWRLLLYSPSSLDSYVPGDGWLQGREKWHIQKIYTHACFFTPGRNNAIQVSNYNNLPVLFFPRRGSDGPARLNIARDFVSQVNICLLLDNESPLFLISRAGGQLEFPSSLLGHCFLFLLLLSSTAQLHWQKSETDTALG